MKKSVIVLAMTTILAPVHLAHADVSGSVSLGYDDNPFKLRGSLDPDGAMFSEIELDFDHKTEGGLRLKLGADVVKFESDADDADSYTLGAGISYEFDGSFFGKDTEYSFGADYRRRDKTYVSRTTGMIGDSGGTPTPDRFDSDTFSLFARADVELTDKAEFRLTVDGRDRTYEDYDSLGLTNLDHRQWSVEGRLTFEPSPNQEISGQLSFSKRDYDDREGRDLLGVLIPGTSLEYEMRSFDLRWTIDLSDNQDIRFSYGHDIREDNLSGYYDTTTDAVGVRYRYRASDRRRFDADLSYRDYSYDNSAPDSVLENEEPISSKEGYRLKLGYEHALGERDTWLFVRGSYEDYDSVDDVYVYDKMVFQVGVMADF
ncbi:MAG: hypothetical protein EP347_05975 [Alphaproteobacteria bacterium]|nr:MAG: hypothetical protein EP347_05975 [Alphaproteobacteria bacterium]